MPHRIDFDNIPFFRGLGRVERARLIPYFTTESYKPGDYLVKQGEAGDSFFIILEGEASVMLHQAENDPLEVACLRSGECFGEVALITGERRTADVVAISNINVLRLARRQFTELIQKNHVIAVHVAGMLAERIKNTNDLLREGTEPAERVSLEDPDPDESLPSSKGLQAGWGLGKPLHDRRVFSLLLAAATCILTTYLLANTGVTPRHLILFELLLGATIVWSFDAFSYHAVALILPLAAVILGAAAPETAFSGFSSPSWFLVLGVFAISAAISRTGLMYRLVLLVIRRFPPSYLGQSFALAAAGLLLTPVIPSSNGRAVLAGPLVANLSEILRFRKGSAGSIGMSMAALLGFGHMSFMFMNGTATCLLALGLLPKEVSSRITWGGWISAAAVLGVVFFSLSYAAAVLFYRPRVERRTKGSVIQAQLAALGKLGSHERITLWTVTFSLTAFLTQPWHHVNGAWVSLLSFFILFSGGVLTEKSVRSEIDWNFLISFGALVGFGSIITSSGLGEVMAHRVAPFLKMATGNTCLFLVTVSLLVHLLRFALPLPAAQLVSILSVVPVASHIGIDPFVLCLVVLISCNPWFFPYQNSIYLNLIEATEGKLFNHRQTRTAATAHVIIVQISIMLSVPYWQYLGLIKG